MTAGGRTENTSARLRPGGLGFSAALAAIVIFAAALAVIARAGHGLTVDEPFMANSVRLPWRDLFVVFKSDNVPLSYAALKGWTAIFGESELALRSLSIIAYAGAVWLAGLAGREAHGPAAGLTAAILMATSVPIGISHAATARPYALLALMTAAALVQSLGLLRAGNMSGAERRWRTAALSATHVLGLWTHPTYAFIAIAGAVASMIVYRRFAPAVAVASAVALAAYGAVWGAVLQETWALQATSWIRPPRARDVETAYGLLWGNGPGFILIGALVAAGLTNGRRLRDSLSTTTLRWVCITTAAAWLLPLIVSFWKPVFVASRTPMMLLPLTAVLAGSALAAVAGRAALVVLCLLFTVVAARKVAAGRPGGDPVPTREQVARVLEDASCGDTVVAAGLADEPVRYYLRRLEAPACLHLERFPANLLNWTGRMTIPDERRRIEEEARNLAARVAVRPGRVWMFTLSRGMAYEASAILEPEVRQAMSCEAVDARGAFFDAIVRCQSR
jgi:hypothetical protein